MNIKKKRLLVLWAVVSLMGILACGVFAGEETEISTPVVENSGKTEFDEILPDDESPVEETAPEEEVAPAEVAADTSIEEEASPEEEGYYDDIDEE